MRFTVVIDHMRYAAYKRGAWWWVRWSDGKLMRRALKVTNRNDAERAIYDTFAPAASSTEENLGVRTVEKKPIVRVQDVVAKFLEHCEVLEGLKPKTLAKYRSAYGAFIRFCTREGIARLDLLAPSHLVDFQKYRQKTEGCAATTVHHDCGCVKRLIKFACSPTQKLLTEDMAAEWKVKKPKPKQRHCFTEDNVRMLQDGVRSWLKPIVTTLAYTGMRIGELEYLRWQDVDLEGGMIHITAREDWQPKNGESRSVPIHPEVDVAMRKLKLGNRGGWVFRTPRGKQVNQNHIREALDVDKKRLHIAEGTPHSFRHFFVSLCANNGVPERVCMTWVGHKDSEVVRYYYHLHDPVSKRAMRDLVKQTACHSDFAQSCTIGLISGEREKKETA